MIRVRIIQPRCLILRTLRNGSGINQEENTSGKTFVIRFLVMRTVNQAV